MPDKNGHLDPLEAADHAMLEHNPDKYEERNGRVFRKSFSTSAPEPVKADVKELETRLLASLALMPKVKPMLAKIRVNSDGYKVLKATVFAMGFSVGTSRTTEADRMFSGIKIEVDDSLKEPQYFDQHGNRMQLSSAPPPSPA